jgi:putative transposase
VRSWSDYDVKCVSSGWSATSSQSRGLVRPRDRHDTIRVFEFMSANQVCFPVAAMARVLGVSTAGYYAWADRQPSARAVADAALLKRIRTVHLGSRKTYGSPRVHAELRGLGERHGRKRIARLMREAGLVGASHRRGGPVTTRRDQEARSAPDLVDRDFTAAGPNQLWVADITYVPTAAGFLYLAVVLDAFSRRIVGWSMANHLRAELVLDALEMAVGQRRPHDVIHHSDQGSQPGFKGSSQRLPASIVAPRQRLRRVFSSQGSFAVWH